jgi:SAM-dependent methyltransferase
MTAVTALSLDDWSHPADEVDRAMLDLCVGSTLDVGCGPGRLTEELAARGHVTMGIDLTCQAVGQAAARGVAALHRDVFDPIPGEGRWMTALLADGNVGIGGDPVSLLDRVRRLIDPRGRIVAEVAPAEVPAFNGIATLSQGGEVMRSFGWSVVGLDGIDAAARAAGLVTREIHRFGDRRVVVLEAQA